MTRLNRRTQSQRPGETVAEFSRRRKGVARCGAVCDAGRCALDAGHHVNNDPRHVVFVDSYPHRWQ